MGIVGALFYVVVIAALVYGWIRLRTSDPALVWVGRVMLFMAILLVVKIVDAYFVPLRTPLDGPVYEHLPENSSKVHEPPPLELKSTDPQPQLDDAEAEHRRRMMKFEERKN